jgi:copper chaperone CopZ
MRATLLAVFLLPALAGAQPAKVEPKPEKITYRLTGLFSPDREKDLRAAFEELPDFKLVAVSFDEAEVTVEFTPAKLFPNQKPERVTELVNEKLRGVTRGTFGVKPRRTVPREKLEQVVIPAAGLDCKACCLAAYEAVAAIDGVEQATASFKEGRVTALIDPTRTSKEKLEEALKKTGVDLGKPKP